jgi:hypothetical protein
MIHLCLVKLPVKYGKLLYKPNNFTGSILVTPVNTTVGSTVVVDRESGDHQSERGKLGIGRIRQTYLGVVVVSVSTQFSTSEEFY